MDRRSLLARLGAAIGPLLAGCSGRQDETGQSRTPPSAGDADAVAGVELPVPKSQLRDGVLEDSIPAITDPAFGTDWQGLNFAFKPPGVVHATGTIEPRLRPDDRVIGVEREGRARAYPLRILNWHEIVNDDFGGPLLVTYCPLCGSGVSAERTVDGAATIFGVSGYLWNANLVMDDHRTDSLWSQIAATAIRGPRTGERLQLLPSALTTWASWRETHPSSEVLLPPPESNTIRGPVARDYTTNPYSDYEHDDRIGINQNPVPEHDADLHPKEQVLGVLVDGVAKAYPLAVVTRETVVNDVVADLPVVVTTANGGRRLVAYDRRVDGGTHRFEAASKTHLLAGGSRWTRATGRAVDGPHEGTVLSSASAKPQLFWFAWLDFHPETAVYTGSA